MIGGKSWLELATVSAVMLGFITLLLVIQARDRGRSRGEIVRTTALVWACVSLTIGLAWLLESRWGGALFDVQLGGGARVVTRSLGMEQALTLGGLLAAMVALYVVAVLSVRRLMERRDEDALQVFDEPHGGGR